MAGKDRLPFDDAGDGSQRPFDDEDIDITWETEEAEVSAAPDDANTDPYADPVIAPVTDPNKDVFDAPPIVEIADDMNWWAYR